MCGEDGKKLSDMWEAHIIERRKEPNRTEAVDDWICLFNAGSEEDLKMIKTKSKGMTEAMEVLRSMSLGKTLRYMYEQRLKAIRDRRAEDEYVWDMGKAEGIAQSALQLLEEYGPIPPELIEKIKSEKDCDVLGQWFKIAAKTSCLQKFREETRL